MFANSCKKDNDNPNPSANSVTDIDGNVYHMIIIGTQVWMVENLKTTKFNDGVSIPLITDNTAWGNLSTPGYCWYNNDGAKYKNTYGALYNWFAINSGKLAPTGWHVPTDADWTTLINYLGGDSIAGGKLKEKGTSHWDSPNTGATNETGFTALPGGYRYIYGSNYLNSFASWWSSAQVNTSEALSRGVYNIYTNIYSYHELKVVGLSVRCLKD